MGALILALLPAIYAAWPLFGARFIPTHDGEYHIIRFWQFFTMLSAGDWFPRWAPDLNYGLGIPLFVFQYPFPNYVGSFFHAFGVSFVRSVPWTLASGYLVALTFCFLWLRRIFGTKPAIAGTIAGAFVPYWFVDLYIRGSVGEVWALTWVFAALWGITCNRHVAVTITAALLVLSHNILALLFVPIIGCYALIHDKRHIGDIALGIGMAAYFWLPALLEQRYITGLSPVHMYDHFPALWQLLIPSWGSGFRGQVSGGNEMSYQIGIAPMLLLSITLFLIMMGKERQKHIIFFTVCFLVASILMLPYTAALWRIVPFAHFIQYPWRLLSVVVVATPALAVSFARRFRFGWGVALVAVLIAFGYSRPVTYEPRADTHYLTRDSFTKSTSSLGNAFQTIWMRADVAATPEFTLSGIPIEVRKMRPTMYAFTVSASDSGILLAPIAYYPGWQAQVDGKRSVVSPSTEGLLSFPVPPGTHTIRIWFGSTWLRYTALTLSVASLFVAALSFILRKRRV